MSLFVVSNDGDDDYISVSPVVASLLLKAFKKQHSYWLYKFSLATKKNTSKPTIQQLNKISLLRHRVDYYSGLIDSLTNGIDRCEYQKSKCN